jgi:hypothetical protein
MRIWGFVIFASLAVIPHGASAEVYKCVDEQGAVSFQDKPCDLNDQQSTVAIETRQTDPTPARNPAPESDPVVINTSTDPVFQSKDPDKTPFSVPIAELEQRLNNDPSSDGVKMHIGHHDGVLSFDIYESPGETSAAAIVRVLFMAFRLAEKDYTRVSLVDTGTEIFSLDASDAQSIGQQFVWGEAGAGQNPIALIRQFADALRDDSGNRVAPPFNGSLLGDTSKALDTLNDRFHPDWTFATIDIQ